MNIPIEQHTHFSHFLASSWSLHPGLFLLRLLSRSHLGNLILQAFDMEKPTVFNWGGFYMAMGQKRKPQTGRKQVLGLHVQFFLLGPCIFDPICCHVFHHVFFPCLKRWGSRMLCFFGRVHNVLWLIDLVSVMWLYHVFRCSPAMELLPRFFRMNPKRKVFERVSPHKHHVLLATLYKPNHFVEGEPKLDLLQTQVTMLAARWRNQCQIHRPP